MSNRLGGAFQMSRQIFENPIWHDVIKFRLFFYIVGNAVFSEAGVRIGSVNLQRGQFLRSYRNLATDLEYLDNRSIKKYSVSVIKRRVHQLVEEGRLEIEETELGTLFTVVNYSVYQGLGNYKTLTENSERTDEEQPENKERTNGEQRENNNKNDNNVKKDKNDNNVEKNSRKRVYDEDSVHFQLANRLYQRILKNNPDHKKPNLQTWANHIRLMMEIDKRTEEQLIYLIDWCQKDSFWMTNILSTSKLREKYDTLVMQIKAGKKKAETVTPPNYKDVKTDEQSSRSNEQDTGPFRNVQLYK